MTQLKILSQCTIKQPARPRKRPDPPGDAATGRGLSPAPLSRGWRRWHPVLLSLSLYLPRRVVRDVHRSIPARASQRRHRYTGKWLTPSDPLILAGAASDDMGATVHVRLRLVGVASIKGRKNLVTVAVGQHASAVNVFLVSRRHAQCGASC